MKRYLALLFCFALACPAFGQDDAKKDPPAPDKKPPAEDKADDKKPATDEKKDKKDPKKGDKKEEEEKKEPEPVSPGAILPRNFGANDLAPALETATVKTILPKFAGATPEMVVTSVTAEIAEEENAPNMQATFELKPKLSIDPMINVMSYLPKKYKSRGKGWPQKKTAHFVIDEIQADSAPNNFAAAVLIDSMLVGVEIPDNVILFSAIDKTGKITRGADKARSDTSYLKAIQIAADSARPQPGEDEEVDLSNLPSREDLPAPDKTVIVITGKVPDGTLDDLIIDEDYATLNSTIVLRCKTHDEAMTLIGEIAHGGEIGKTITELAEAQKVLRDKSVRTLSNDAVWKRVVAAGKAFEGNATAFAYARLRTRKVSETYSLDRCLTHINDTVAIVRGNSLDKFKDRELRKFVRDKTTEIKDLGRMVHPDAAPVASAALIYIAELQDYAEAKQKAESKVKDRKDAEIPERATEARNAAAKAYNEARAAALKKNV